VTQFRVPFPAPPRRTVRAVQYKRLRFHTGRARKLIAGIARREPNLFAHWKLGVRPDGCWMVGAG